MQLKNNNKYENLIQTALEARTYAYAPYSNFYVGAALLGKNDVIYQGANMENASYPVGNCAERTAFCNALMDGQRAFTAIAIVGGGKDAEQLEYCTPCGICRQMMREFCNPDDFEIIVAKNRTDYEVYTLAELLPMSFGPANLEPM